MVREFSTRVAGIYYNRGGVSGLSRGDVVRLVRDPNNQHDANAVRVEAQDGSVIGHVPKEIAASLARDLDSGLRAYAIIEHTSEGRAPVPARGRRRHGSKASPPLCLITVKVGDGELTTMPSLPPPQKRVAAPHVTIIRAPAVEPAPKPVPSTIPSAPAKPGSSCFVATAVFRDADHPTVTALRHWRDTSLVRHRPGRMFIRAYALTGPRLACVVAAIPSSRLWLAPLLAIVAQVAARPRPRPKR
jgi:hypothetical protein